MFLCSFNVMCLFKISEVRTQVLKLRQSYHDDWLKLCWCVKFKFQYLLSTEHDITGGDYRVPQCIQQMLS